MGYDVSVEDLAAEKAAAKEISPEDLEAVAGGVPCRGPFTDWCWYDYYCYFIWGHAG